MFYGLPIHIMRDLFMTARSFLKRLTAFHRYRNATKDMNVRYADATVADIAREDTCIICREVMRPWSVTNPQAPPVAPGALPPARPAASANEKTRPKKLPCGHALHLSCLKSWLERQQTCPICRTAVDSPPVQAPGTAANNGNPAAPGAQPPVPGQQNGVAQPAPPRAPGRGMRMLNIGPLRVGFGQANLRDFQQMGAPQAGQENEPGPRVYGLELGFPRRAQPQPTVPQNNTTIPPNTIPEHLHQIEQHLAAQIRALEHNQQELRIVQLLQTELARLRLIRNGAAEPLFPTAPGAPPIPGSGRQATPPAHMQRHRAHPGAASIDSGSIDLPPGVTIPEGWSLLPLQRLDSVANVRLTQPGSVAGPVVDLRTAPTTTTQPSTNPLVHLDANNRPSNVVAEQQIAPAAVSDTSILNPSPSPIPEPSSIASENTIIPESSTSNNTLSNTENRDDSSSSSLPNWGSNQLFSNPGQSSGADGTSASTSTFPLPSTSESERPAGSEMSTEQGVEGKGKAKAVSMEDTEDEAEGL